MAPPEYNKTYIPSASVDYFESLVSGIRGAEIGSKRAVQKDFESREEDLTPDDLATALRATLDKLPGETPLIALASWDASSSFKREFNIKAIPLWREFILGLKPAERRLTILSLNTARGIKWPSKTTLEEAMRADWATESVRGLGAVTRSFLTKVFPK